MAVINSDAYLLCNQSHHAFRFVYTKRAHDNNCRISNLVCILGACDLTRKVLSVRYQSGINQNLYENDYDYFVFIIWRPTWGSKSRPEEKMSEGDLPRLRASHRDSKAKKKHTFEASTLQAISTLPSCSNAIDCTPAKPPVVVARIALAISFPSCKS